MRSWIAAGMLGLALWAGTQQYAILQGTMAHANRPVVSPHITEGPVVQYVSAQHAVVSWTTNVNMPTVLRYGTSHDNLSATDHSRLSRTNHRADLSRLKPDTTYYYQVFDSAKSGSHAISEISSFKTKNKGTRPVRNPERH